MKTAKSNDRQLPTAANTRSPLLGTSGPAVEPLLLLAMLIVLNGCGREERRTDSLLEYVAAKSHYARGELDTAEALLRKCCRADPTLYQARLLLAKTLFFQERYEEAETLLVDLERRHPAYHESAIWLVRVRMQRGSMDRARIQLENLLSYDASDPRLCYLMAQVYLSRDDVENAIAFLERAALFADELAKIHLELGGIYYRFHRDERALREIRLALSILPDESPLRGPAIRMVEMMQSEGGEP